MGRTSLILSSNRSRPTWLVFALAVAATPASAQTRHIQFADLGREVGLEQARISPDGEQVAVVMRRANYEDNRFDRSLVLVDVHSGVTRVLTPGRHNIAEPRWSPAGDRVAFRDSEDGKPAQLYVLPLGGGEAQRVTDQKRGVQTYVWHPDGASFAFLGEEEPVEPTGEERHNKSFEVGDNVYLAQSASLPVQVWLVPASGGKSKRLTSAPRSVTGVTWTGDGKSLVLGVQPGPFSSDGLKSTLVTFEIDSGAERPIAASPSLLSSFTASPDGRLLALSHPRGPEPFFRPNTVSVASIAGGEPRLVTGGLDRHIQSVSWLPDNSGLLVLAPDGTRVGAWVARLDAPARRLDFGSIDPSSSFDFSKAGPAVFIGQEPHRPAELYLLPSLEASPRRITDQNREIAALDLGRVETIRWDGPDGFKENGVLIYPPGAEPGRRYPLVLSIHGGPMGTSTEGWSAFGQLLAAQGWMVFEPNYRGSNNLGDAYQRAVINDAGDGPGRDVMAGVKAVKALGVVDESQVAVSGWSYGGYMTAWLTSHYQGWRAAVAGAAVTDWYDWYSLADLNVWAGFGLNGSPWRNNNAANYWRQSPMAYAHLIKTPTLILSDVGDPRVTVTQSYKLYHALKDNGVEVQFIAYPIGGHFPADPVHQRDVYRRWIGWIDQHFKGATPNASGAGR